MLHTNIQNMISFMHSQVCTCAPTEVICYHCTPLKCSSCLPLQIRFFHLLNKSTKVQILCAICQCCEHEINMHYSLYSHCSCTTPIIERMPRTGIVVMYQVSVHALTAAARPVTVKAKEPKRRWLFL